MQDKLNAIENDQTSTLNTLLTGIESIRSTIDFGKLQELKNDVRTTMKFLSTLQTKLASIEQQVQGTNQRTAETHGLHDERSNEIIDVVERSSTWGFWSYFFIFQVLFWGAVIWWKRTQDEKNSKRIAFD